MIKESTDKIKWLLNGRVYDHIFPNIRKHFIQAIAAVALFLTPGLISGQSNGTIVPLCPGQFRENALNL